MSDTQVFVGVYLRPRIQFIHSPTPSPCPRLFRQELHFTLEVSTSDDDPHVRPNGRLPMLCRVFCLDAESIQAAFSPPLSNWTPACRLLVSVTGSFLEDGVIRGTGLRALPYPSFSMPGIPRKRD